MMVPAYRVWPKKTAQFIDNVSVEVAGDRGSNLMHEAGKWVANAVAARIKLHQHLLIIAGNGNNGGDAIVAAIELRKLGFPLKLVTISDNSSQRRSYLRNKFEEAALVAGITPEIYRPGIIESDRASFIIDGLLGLGFKPPLRAGVTADILREISLIQDKTVLSIDIPSGLDADDWDPAHVPLRADYTVTFGSPKPVHTIAPGRSHCGQTLCMPINFNRPSIDKCDEQITIQAINQTSYQKCAIWGQLAKDAHKFDRGHILVIGGSNGKWGAPILSGLAAQSVGAGWVSIAMPQSRSNINISFPLSLTQENIWQNETKIDATQLAAFIENRKVRSLVIGPGCTESPLDDDVLAVIDYAIKHLEISVVLDAGALKNISQWFEKNKGSNLKFDEKKVLLTPHPGEWIKIEPKSKAPCHLEDLKNIQREIIEKWGVSLLYKSSTPISIHPKSCKITASVHISGKNQLAKAGSGDILTGIAATIGSQKVPAYHAGIWAYSILCDAADHAAKYSTASGITPEDIINSIKYVVK